MLTRLRRESMPPNAYEANDMSGEATLSIYRGDNEQGSMVD
jgi:hypothetical protein